MPHVTDLQILRDIRDTEDLQALQAIVNGDVFYDAILHFEELIDAAQSMLDYPDIFANRLRAALAKVNHA